MDIETLLKEKSALQKEARDYHAGLIPYPVDLIDRQDANNLAIMQHYAGDLVIGETYPLSEKASQSAPIKVRYQRPHEAKLLYADETGLVFVHHENQFDESFWFVAHV